MPQSAWRSNLKIGAFYPPISLEHRASGWTNPYTISSSALNTWVGEELRTIGVGVRARASGHRERRTLGFRRARRRVRLERSGWRDARLPRLLAERPADAAVRSHRHVAHSAAASSACCSPRSMIGPATMWAPSASRHRPRAARAALRQSRRPAVFKASIQRLRLGHPLRLVGLRDDGRSGESPSSRSGCRACTDAGPDPLLQLELRDGIPAGGAGVRAASPRRRATFRRLRSCSSPLPGSTAVDEDGHAWTLGWTWKLREHLELIAEWLQIDSTYNWRAALGEPARRANTACSWRCACRCKRATAVPASGVFSARRPLPRGYPPCAASARRWRAPPSPAATAARRTSAGWAVLRQDIGADHRTAQ